MIEPIESLAFSIQANPGVYAVLLGSGVSKAANIPTGWEVTVDLIQKMAAQRNELEQCKPNPEKWYVETVGKVVDYSDLLNDLAKTPTERQQLLKSYFEPDEEERERGEKQPTLAHQAIAALVAKGHIKVIITTNFDRLMETALAAENITPTVISTEDQISGALPLTHIKVLLLKVHGDYLDSRILNTIDELTKYSENCKELLDRILDEFGLIVCGWSATWDIALREAIESAKNRRFTTYWALHGEASEEANGLIQRRQAQIIDITDADSFFSKIQQQVEAILEYSKPHPLSVEAAVANVKRYLSEDQQIKIKDIVDEAANKIIEATSDGEFPVNRNSSPNAQSVTACIKSYESICSTMLAIAPIGSFFGREDQYYIWDQVLRRFSVIDDKRSEPDLWNRLRRYPATLLFYTLGLGAVAAKKYDFIGQMFSIKIAREYEEDIHLVHILPPVCLFTNYISMQLLEEFEKHHVPLNSWLNRSLREPLKRVVPDDNQYTEVFDKFEILTALSCGYYGYPMSLDYWAAWGEFIFRSKNENRFLQEIEDSIGRDQENSEFVMANIFGDTPEICLQNIANYKKFIREVRNEYRIW